MIEFEKEKSSLHIDEAVQRVLELINTQEFEKALNILIHLTSQFEQGLTLENTDEVEYYSFTDNIEFFTKVIENAHGGKTTNVSALNPNYGRMYHLLGYLYMELGKEEAAKEALQKSLRWNPVSAGTYLEFAEIYKKAGDWDHFLPLAISGLKYSKTPATIARAFRGLGYYNCEKRNLELAASLYMHSLQFEENKEIVGREVAYIYELSDKTLDLPDPDGAVKTIMENNLDVEISNYVFAGYTKFLQALKEADEKDAYTYYEELVKKMIFSPDKIEYLKTI